MRDKKKNQPANHADRLPAFFSVLEPILDRQMKRIAEDMGRFLERNVVLAPVGAVLGFVPFEPEGCHDKIVVTKGQLGKPALPLRPVWAKGRA